MIPLLDNQSLAIKKLSTYKVGALFMSPGTGKTRTTIELVNSSPCDVVLWIGPYQTLNTENPKHSVPYEIDKWGGFTKFVHFVAIESIQMSDRIYLEVINFLQNASNPFIVIDESLSIKNNDAKRTKRMLYLSNMAEYKLVLNGTPLSRNLLDLWSQMQFLSQKILQMGMAEFKNNFVEYTKITYHKGRKSYSKEFINKYHNVAYLYELISPYVFESELELDVKKQYINIDYEIDDEISKDYTRIKELILNEEYMMTRGNNIFLELTQKLQNSYSRTSEKFQIVSNLLKANPNDKFLIFAKFVETQELLKEKFPNVKILSYAKHSKGLNLQEYNCIIYFDKTWDYAQRLQSERRIERTGTTHELLRFYDLTGNTGLEEMMNKNIARKGLLFNYFKKATAEQLEKVL